MKSYFAAAASLVLIIGFSSCKKVDGNGQVISEERTLSSFNKLKSSIDAEIVYVEGAGHKVEIIAESNLIPHIETDVDDNALEIEPEEGYTRLNPGKRIRIIVTAPGLREVNTFGSADFFAEIVREPLFTAKTTGSGSIHIEAVAEMTKFNAIINGSGNIEIKGGMIGSQDIEITGSGDVNNFGLRTGTTEVRTMGSGDAHVNADDFMKVRITGSGDVYYYGSPETDISITGSGDVVKM